jgi:hypothetical protein
MPSDHLPIRMYSGIVILGFALAGCPFPPGNGAALPFPD